MAPSLTSRPSTPSGTREDTREARESSRLPLAEPEDAVEELIERVARRHGGTKALAGGLVPISYPHIRKMANDGAIPNLRQLLRFMELAGPDDPFRLELIACCQRMFAPTAEQIAERVEAAVGRGTVSAKEAGQLVREAFSGQGVLLEDALPGRRGNR